MFCVFGAMIDWKIISKQMDICKANTLVAYTDYYPKIDIPNIIWEELDFKIPEESYGKWSCHHEYIQHCMKKIRTIMPNNYTGKIVYVFENTLYTNFTEQIVFSENLQEYFFDLPFTESVKILSESHVKIKDKIKNISQVDFELRKNIFEKLYDNKVLDFKNFIPDSKEFENKKIFFLVSVIRVKDADRSLYTPQERLKQTQKQIESIRNKISNVVIVMLETSSLTFSEMYQLNPDYLILFDKHDKTSYYAHDHTTKHITEAYILSQILPLFTNINYSHFCKFGGRYYLHKNFDEKEFFNDLCTFRKIDVSFDQVHPCYDSILYSIPKKYESNFFHINMECIAVMLGLHIDIERSLALKIPEENIPVKHIKNLNVCGYYAAAAEYNWV